MRLRPRSKVSANNASSWVANLKKQIEEGEQAHYDRVHTRAWDLISDAPASGETRWRVCHDPALIEGLDPYYRECRSYKEAYCSQQALSLYDLHLERVGVLSEAGATWSSIQWFHPTDTSGEWEDVEPEEAFDRGWITEAELRHIEGEGDEEA